jgi:hypothetical protein
LYSETKSSNQALEATVIPGQFFGPREGPSRGISAVQALSTASAEGQRIFKITNENLDAALPELQLGSTVVSDIRSSVLNGMEVTVSESTIEHHGWSGVGYIVLDPETGTGGYLISVGANGGFDPLEILPELMFFLGWAQDLASFLAKASLALADYKTAL